MLIKQSSSGIVRTFLLTGWGSTLGYTGAAAVTVRLSKNGGTFAPGGGAAPQLLESGIYKYVYTTTDVNTLGSLTMSCRASGAEPRDLVDEIVTFDPYVAWQSTADIQNRLNEYGAVRPVTSGRQALLGSAGHIGIDWQQVTNPASTVGLVGTTVHAVDSVSALGVTAKSDVRGQAEGALLAYEPLKAGVSGRLLDVSATGEAGIDWANIGSPDTVVSLGGTTVRGSGMIITSVTGAVGSVTGNVGGNVTGSIGSVASSGILISSLQPEASIEIADRVLRRGLANVEQVADARSLAWAAAKLVNRVGISTTTLTAYKTDDTSAFFSQAVTTSGGALPIIEANTN